MIVLFEPLYFAMAVRDGWATDKLRAWAWLLRHPSRVADRRRRVQAAVTSPRALDSLLTPTITQTQLEQPSAVRLLNRGLALLLAAGTTACWLERLMALLRALGAKATEWRRRPVPTSEAPFVSPDVVVLRTNPRDSSLARVITVLVEEYRTLALVWDRTNSYRCPVQSPRLLVKRSTRAGAYFRLSTVLKVMALQPWFLTSTLRARPKVVHAMDLDTGIIGLLAARLLRVPFVYQCLDPYAASLPVGWPRVIARLVDRIENAVISRAALFIITDLRRLPQHQRASPKAVVELPNIPMWRAEPQPPSTSGLVEASGAARRRPTTPGDGAATSDAPPRAGPRRSVGYVGSLWPHRSLDTIIHTVGGLSDEGISLVMGGFGPLEDDVRRCVDVPQRRVLGLGAG